MNPPRCPWIAALAVAVLAACAGASPPDDEEKPRREPVLSTDYDDERIGKEVSEEVRAEMGLVEDRELLEYVDAVGQRVARHAPRSFDYQFRIVDQEVPNAFALPGGYIFVSRGLLILTNSEDELANVLGHEIVHVASRHAAARQQVVRGVPGIFQFLQMGSLAAYGRDQERTADRLGQGMSGLAGYDPKGMSDFLRALERTERLKIGASRIPRFFDTHPATAERVGEAAARAGRIAWTRKPGIAADRQEFLKRMEGLAVGLSAAEGVFRGSRFLHPDLGFTLRFPDGWETRNTHTAVGAIAHDRRAQVVLEGEGPGRDPRAAAEKFVVKAQRQGLNVHGGETVRLGGSAGWRAYGTASTPRGTLHAVITWIAFRGSVYRIMGLSLSKQHEGVFVNVARSFKPLSRELAGSFTEKRLKVVEAQAGETLAALGERAGNQWDLQHTAVINDVFATAALEAGTPVKVAVVQKYVPISLR